ncbi:(4S)-4-hydroxy-5-phosphonooxypentane-2,3-dione isomerase [Vanrija pseudolonga]|uniref:(4S)-4-hydroxy-5-phosphonooxypentane-2,3-dione isomerase n=1 Tax=Vanrija pseudolonga TaxID=143232 RepID=A0AAF0Y8I2_9TREE|nr:(4S)-4-hydroxy-5-phosphonooxypentane-2,3-dione isomerase [Vanrija pseudolonga]
MTVTFTASYRVVDAAAAQRVQELVRAVRDASATEPGTLVFSPARKAGDDLAFFVYEEYADQAALDAHLATPQFQALIGEAETLFVGGKAGLKIEYYDKL